LKDVDAMSLVYSILCTELLILYINVSYHSKTKKSAGFIKSSHIIIISCNLLKIPKDTDLPCDSKGKYPPQLSYLCILINIIVIMNITYNI
jgi:hypothetical protein